MSDTPAPEVISTPSPDVAPDALIRQFVAEAEAKGLFVETASDAVPGNDGAPATEVKVAPAGNDQIPAEANAETQPSTEGSPTTGQETEAPSATLEAKPEDETVAVARARKMLDAATRKEKESHERVQNVTRDLATQLRTNPKAVLAKLGLSMDELIDASLAETDGPAAPAAPDKVTELETRLRQFEDRELEVKVQAAISKIHTDLKADARFPLINRAEAHEEVTDRMVAYVQQHGTRISWDQAAKLVEMDLRDQAKRLGVNDAPKVSPPAAKATRNASAPQQRQGTTTLTNSEVRDSVTPESENLPEDPRKLVEYYARRVSL